jgi:ribosomal protein L21E
LKQHKPRFYEECLSFSDKRKQAKMQWLQDPNQSNVDNLNNVRREANRHFRNNKTEYLKAKMEDFEINSKTRISETIMAQSMTKNGYHLRTNTVMDENGDSVTGSHRIMARRRNHLSLNVHRVNDGRQIEIQTTEPVVTVQCL